MKRTVELENGMKIAVGDEFYTFGAARSLKNLKGLPANRKNRYIDDIKILTKGMSLLRLWNPNNLDIIECIIREITFTMSGKIKLYISIHMCDREIEEYDAVHVEVDELYMYATEAEARAALDKLAPTFSIKLSDIPFKALRRECVICVDDDDDDEFDETTIEDFQKFVTDHAGMISDGYHTFNDLYSHRAVLLANLVNTMPDISWKSRRHEDGSMFDGMFIVGIHLPTGDITYHIKESDRFGSNWELFKCEELKNGPAFDGHTPDDVVRRLRENCK